MTQIKQRSLIEILFTVLIVTYPILNQYASFIHTSIGISDLIYIAFLAYILIQGSQRKLYINRDYTVFILVTIILTFFNIILVNSYSLHDVAFRVLRDLLYWSIIAISIPNMFHKKVGYKIIKYISILITFSIIYQIIVYFVLKKVAILWLPLTFRGGFTITERINFIKQYASEMYYRPYSFFTEPTYAAFYSIIGLILYLFTGNNVRSIIFSLFITIGIFLSTSVSGIGVAIFIWCIWLICVLHKRKGSKKIVTIAFLLVFMGCFMALFLFTQTPIGSLLINRLSEVGHSGSEASSGYIRIIRGYKIFLELDLKNLLTGIGFGNLYPYMLDHINMSHFLVLNGEQNEFVNSISYFLISTGFIGFCSLIILFSKWFKQSGIVGQVAILVTFILMLSDSVYNSSTWILLMTILFFSKKGNDKRSIYV